MAAFAQPGETIGRFRVESELGRGGMGVVYRAVDPALGRPVAIKLLAPHLSTDAGATARFRREALAAAGLRHPGIATVYDIGEHEGCPYIALELIPGRPLSALLGIEGRVATAEALGIVAQVASALDHAHAHGVYHRDVKPSNIIVDGDGRAVLVDFGLAYAASVPAITASTALLGTPAYMAPEQIRGDPLDGRADQYSLAAVCFELLTGSPPFGSLSPHAILQRALYEAPPALSERDPASDGQLDATLDRALAKDPADRFPDCASFAQALGAPAPSWGSSAGLAQPVVAAPRPAAGWRRQVERLREPRMRLAAAGLAVLLVAAIVTPITLLLGGDDTPAEAAPGPPPPSGDLGSWAQPGGDSAGTNADAAGVPRVEGTPRWAVVAGVAGGSGLVVAGDRVVFASGDGTLRVLSWWRGDAGEQIPFGGTIVGDPAVFELEDELVAYVATDDGRLLLFGLGDGELRLTVRRDQLGGIPVAGPVLAEDGSAWLATDSGMLAHVRPNGAVQRVDLSKNGGLTGAPSLAGASVFVAAGGTLVAVDTATGTEAWSAPAGARVSTRPAVAVGSGVVIVGSDDGRMRAFSAQRGTALWGSEAVSSPVSGIAIDAKGLVIAVHEDGSVRAFRLAGGAAAWTVAATNTAPAGPPIADGDEGANLVVVSADGQVRYYRTADGSEDAAASFALGEPILYPPVAAGGYLFLRGDRVIALGPRAPLP